MNEGSEPPSSNRDGDKPLTVSEKQAAANRNNARRSTGPRSSSGKARSAKNATKHGAYAAPVAITTGAFVEDPLEMEQFVEDIVAALGPRDAIERVAAGRVAAAVVHADRVTRYTALRYAAAATVSFTEEALANSTGLGVVNREHIAAKKLFVEALEQGTVLDSRVGREIQRTLDMYAKLQKRELPKPPETATNQNPRNEPISGGHVPDPEKSVPD